LSTDENHQQKKMLVRFSVHYGSAKVKGKNWGKRKANLGAARANSLYLNHVVSYFSRNVLARVQRVHKSVDFWDITFCTRRF
jgi:hypothetical protein